jgi:hypothetical protein
MTGFCISGFIDFHGTIRSEQRPSPGNDHGMVVDDQDLGYRFDRILLHLAPFRINRHF